MKGLPEDDESRMAAAGNLAERRIESAGPPKAVWQPVSRQPAWRRVQQVSAVVERQRSAQQAQCSRQCTSEHDGPAKPLPLRRLSGTAGVARPKPWWALLAHGRLR